MVYTLMFLVGALSLATTLLDIFLSETQKARLNELSIRTWSWVDEAKSTSIFQRFSSPRSRSIIQKFAYITSLLLYFAFVTTGEFGINGHHHTVKEYWHDPKLAVLFFISAIMMVLIISKLMELVLPYIFKSKNIGIWCLKFFGILVIGILIVVTSLLLLPLLGKIFPENIVALIWFTVIVPFFIVWVPIFLISLVVFGVAVAVLVVYILLYPLEVILRRIAEYPKGPILAVSALTTAIGAFARFFLA